MLYAKDAYIMFYVYILKNPITNLPFYIGVGKENRRSHLSREQSHIVEAMRFREGKLKKRANKHKLNTILQILDQNLSVEIDYIRNSQFINEQCAFDKEIELISYYGRRDLGTGILTNMTNGGEGRVNPSLEARQHQSNIQKGIPSHAKGKKLGLYSPERKAIQQEKMKKTKDLLSEEQIRLQHENRSNSHTGKIPWNKGKTADTDTRIAKYASAKTGKARPDMVGKTPWSKGKTKENDFRLAAISESKKGKPAPNKGVPSGKKGMTYAEIYGPEKAAQMLEKRKLKKLEYWKNKKNICDKYSIIA
jgi:hypothetical protein